MKHRNLASERVRLGLSQKELAEKLGTNHVTLSRYETFRADMPIGFAIKAAEFFGCSIEYLIDRTDERLPK